MPPCAISASPKLPASLRAATVWGQTLPAPASVIVAWSLLHPLKRESRAKWLKVALHKKPCITTPVVRGSRRDASGMTYFAHQGGIAFGSSLGQPEGLRDSSRWSADHRRPSPRSPAP